MHAVPKDANALVLNRLQTVSQFNTVFKQARKIKSRDLVLFFIPNELGIARLGMTIAKRNVPLAVKRNSIKRIIRESFRHQHSHLPSMDIVVMVYKSAGDLSKAECRECIDKRWEELIKLQSK